jgi:hypothetical protein
MQVEKILFTKRAVSTISIRRRLLKIQWTEKLAVTLMKTTKKCPMRVQSL